MPEDEKSAKNSTLYYICPECNMEQIVYLIPEVIEDNSSYKFTTACSNCGEELLVKIGFEVSVGKKAQE